MLDARKDACTTTILHQPFEITGVQNKLKWSAYAFSFMDLRPDNLSLV